MNTKKCVRTLTLHKAWKRAEIRIICFAILPDGTLAAGDSEGKIKVWNVDAGKCIRILHGHTGWVYCLTVTSDGWLVSGSNDMTFGLWKINNFYDYLRSQQKIEHKKCVIL